MKTILTRLKTLITDAKVDSGTLFYVKAVEVVHPDLDLTLQSVGNLPKVLFVPDQSQEEWVASQRKQSTNTVMAYLMLRYHTRESSIMGDTTRPGGQGKGILDFAADFISVVRGTRLSVGGEIYLSKPLDILGVEYINQEAGEGTHLLVAAVTMQCVYLFLQDTLPGDV